MPVLVFAATLIGGLFIVFGTQVTQRTAEISPKYAAACGDCGTQVYDSTQTCPDGRVRYCHDTKAWTSDINNCAGQCELCMDQLACSGTSCGTTPTPPPPPPPPPNTPTPTPTTKPTPTPTTPPTPTPTTPQSTPTPTQPANTPTPTEVPPTGTPTPTSIPNATPTPTVPIGTLTCGTKGCRDNSNPCQSGLTCVVGPDENYCSLPQLSQTCAANPNQANCCTLPTTPTPTLLAARPTLIKTGTSKNLLYLIPAGIVLLGLLL